MVFRLQWDWISSFQIDEVKAGGSLIDEQDGIMLHIEVSVGSDIVQQIGASILCHPTQLKRQNPSLCRIVYDGNVAIDLAD